MELDKKIGAEGDVKLAVQNGKLIITAAYEGASGEVTLAVAEDIGYFLDKLAALIPGTVDDAVIAVIKEALKAIG